MAFDLTPNELLKASAEVIRHLNALGGNWSAYRKLFRGNAESQPILNDVAGHFFWLLERDLRASIFLTFRQLTDGPFSMGKENASFLGLLRAAAGPDYETTHPNLVKLVVSIAATPTIKEHVNKYIAHLDLPLLAGKVPAPTSVEILQVEDALATARHFMNEYMEEFFGEPAFPYEEQAALIPQQIDRILLLLKAGRQNEPAV
jgi:hypothetical protein